jgi:Uma2 family endonuclease
MAINLTHAQSAEGTSPPPRIPPLESGDHLTRREFERRYEAMPELKRAELVEGVVYMPSPVHAQSHAKPHSAVITFLSVYSASTQGTVVLDNPTLRLDEDNEVQPDALLMRDSEHGGKARFSVDDYLEGAPELIVEITATSASNDLRDKLKAYRRNGVQEYAVWQVYGQRFDWWELREGDYASLKPDDAGILRSHIFAGLWLNVPALLSGDLAAVLATLQQGLAT